MRTGRLLLPALRWAHTTGFAHEAAAIDTALELDAGGFIIFGGSAEEVRRLTDDLVRRAGRPLLIGADLERGAGQQFTDLTEFPPPLALAELESPDLVRWAGALTGWEARSVGINWVFGPVADLDLVPENPIIQTRSFGEDPQRVAACVREWILGCQSVGALTSPKHYPGHGRTVVDSHAALPVVDAPADELFAVDVVPFAAAMKAGAAAVMTAHVAYPSLDPSGRAATYSAPIIRTLRDRYGFDGLVVTDALIMGGAMAAAGNSEGGAAVDAVRAGVDLLLYPRDMRAVHTALERAVLDDVLTLERLAATERRYQTALALTQQPLGPPPAGPYESVDALAQALLADGTLRGQSPGLTPPLELLVVDDDLGGPFPPTPSDGVSRELQRAGVPLGTGGSRVLLAFAEPRGWKGRAGFGAAAAKALAELAPTADLVVLFGHPRLVREIPGGAPVLVAWHRQQLMQRAVAHWLQHGSG